MKKLAFAFLAAFLTACSSQPPSYLPEGTKPLVNVEANIAPSLDICAKSEKLSVRNLSEQALNLNYKLFWYDETGVTQGLGDTERTEWQSLWLAPKAEQNVALHKPTAESANYRFYVRGEQAQ